MGLLELSAAMGAACSRDGEDEWLQPVRQSAASSYFVAGALEIEKADGMDAAAERTVAQLVDNIVPFVPRRVAQAFGSGRLNSASTGAVLPPKDPQRLDAAVLLVRPRPQSRQSPLPFFPNGRFLTGFYV